MNYEIVHLAAKKMAGLKVRTSNSDLSMGSRIGELWGRLYEGGVYQSISGKKNGNSIGLYTNYESDVRGEYDVVVGCEIDEDAAVSDSLETAIIPAGKYAKFIVRGHVQQAVANFWMQLWSMDLDRKYSGDFEEYQSGDDMDNAEIHIYIALNE